MKLHHILIILLAFFASCSNTINEEPELAIEDTLSSSKKTGWLRSYYPDGKTKKTEVHYSEGKRDGLARSFYKDGSVCVTGLYSKGKRQGTFKWYYEGTKNIFEEVPYTNDEKNGVKRKFHKNGKIMSEAIFKNDQPGPLKEFDKDGKLIEQATIVCKSQYSKGEYIMEFSMSDGNTKAEYFLGVLNAEGFFHADLMKVKTENGKGKISYKTQSANFKAYPVGIVAKVKTKYQNIYLAHQTFQPGIKY